MKAGKRAVAVVWLLVVAESKFVCMTTAALSARVYSPVHVLQAK
jgi:hypothetical protein